MIAAQPTLPDDPADALAAVGALRRLADRVEDAAVEQAVVDGWSWADIAEALGVTVRPSTRSTRGVCIVPVSQEECADGVRTVHEGARAAVVAAREEARSSGQHTVESEHLFSRSPRGPSSVSTATTSSTR